MTKKSERIRHKIGDDVYYAEQKETQERTIKLAANNLSKQRIEKLFRMFCIHRNTDTCPINCTDCILIDIPYITKKAQKKDLCYAIWHEGILND